MGHRIPTRGAVVEVSLPIYLYFSSPEGCTKWAIFFLGFCQLGLHRGVHLPFCMSPWGRFHFNTRYNRSS